MDNLHKKYIKYKTKYLNTKKQQPNLSPRYIIFAGDHYYPNGGWQDYYDQADTLEEAKRAYENGKREYGWAHIVDLKNKQIILDNWPKKKLNINN